MKRPLVIVLALAFGSVALVLGLVHGLPPYFDRRGHADLVQSAMLLSDGGRDVLALGEIVTHAGEDGAEHRHRVTLLDPTSGKRVARKQLLASTEKARLVGKGQRLLLIGEKLFVLYDLRSGERLDRAQLEAKLPVVLTPWHVWGINESVSGALLVESDDMKWWEVDLGTLQARPTAQRPSSSFLACTSARAWEPGLESGGGEVYVLLNQPIKRYSQASTLALARAKRVEYGSPVEPKFVGDARWSGSSRPSFAATPSGAAIVLRDPESALVVSHPEERRVALHRVTPDGKVLWATELVDDEQYGACAIIPYRDSLLVLRHRLLYSVGVADGKVRWQERL